MPSSAPLAVGGVLLQGLAGAVDWWSLPACLPACGLPHDYYALSARSACLHAGPAVLQVAC